MEWINALVQFLQEHAAGLIHISGASDIFGMGIGTVIVICVAIYVTYYTVKKVIWNLVLGYIVLYAIKYFLHIVIEPTAIMVALMALFGPIPVIIAAGWHFIM